MTSLSRNASVAGLLYIVSSLFGIVRLIYIPNSLIVNGDAAATANNIAAHELLFRFGIVSYLVSSTLWIFVTLALYRLLKGVDQALAVLINDEISRRFSVGNSGGMRRSTIRSLLVLISDPFKGLYQDRWESDILHYTGMGKSGDQSLSTAQNRTLAESRTNDVAVHLVESREPLKYTYMGEVELVEHPYQENQPDERGKLRKVWMFPIRVRESASISRITQQQQHAIEESEARIAANLPIDVLAALAAGAPRRATSREAQVAVFLRNAAVAEYVKRLANGKCDLCTNPAPFLNKQRQPYLESHHITWLSRGGEDTIENTVALCPNCHRKMHVLDRESDKRLRESAERRKIES